MKVALTAVVFTLLIAGGFALPSGDGDRAAPESTPGFDAGHGDYPTHSPIAAQSELSPLKIACLTPDLRRSRHRVG